MLTRFFLAAVIICCTLAATSQYTTDKVVGEKHKSEADSLKTLEYPYIFPFWGEKVINKGFKIPKSAGLSVQYLYQQSDIIIENLAVGFNNGPMQPLDQVIRFDKSVATTHGVNLRPDLWLFPFLNVYLIFAQSSSTTAIDAGVWLPDDSSWKQISTFSTKADFDATTLGFGLTPTVGFGGYFLALDANFSWSDVSALEKPAFAFVFGPRLGKNFTLKKPEMNIAVWVGGFRVKIGSSTTGSLNASEVLPINQWQEKINTGHENVVLKQSQVDSWWNNLTPVEQKSPVNIAKHETANRVLAGYGKFLDEASQVVTGAGNATVQYSLDKRQKDMWNFIIGSQFQINRSWMIRAEYGFLGSRQQFIGGLQYRFNF